MSSAEASLIWSTFRNGCDYFCSTFKYWIHCLSSGIVFVFKSIYWQFHTFEQFVIKLSNIYGFICQLLFFLVCEAVLCETKFGSNQKLISLNTLLVYSILTYFISRIRDICMRDWSGWLRYDNVRQWMFWFMKVILEWSKAVIVVFCLKEQRSSYQPKILYCCVTFVYYLCTEKLYKELIPKTVAYLRSTDSSDSLELRYVTIGMYLYTIIVGVYFCINMMVFTPYATFALIAAYFLVYLRTKDLFFNYVLVMIRDAKLFASFRQANENELKDCRDVCAICLSHMNIAKVTPCNHMFHPHCLRRCLQVSSKCPMCKQSYHLNLNNESNTAVNDNNEIEID